jgi:hypothetical protein
MRAMRLLLVTCAVLLGVVGSAAAENPVRATMSTSSTKPVVDTPWRYTITVKDRAGKPLVAKVRLQVLRETRVVGCWKRTAIVRCSGATAGTFIAFKGKRTGTIRWRARYVGPKLTFQATVVTEMRSLNLRAPLTVRLP